MSRSKPGLRPSCSWISESSTRPWPRPTRHSISIACDMSHLQARRDAAASGTWAPRRTEHTSVVQYRTLPVHPGRAEPFASSGVSGAMNAWRLRRSKLQSFGTSVSHLLYQLIKDGQLFKGKPTVPTFFPARDQSLTFEVTRASQDQHGCPCLLRFEDSLRPEDVCLSS